MSRAAPQQPSVTFVNNARPEPCALTCFNTDAERGLRFVLVEITEEEVGFSGAVRDLFDDVADERIVSALEAGQLNGDKVLIRRGNSLDCTATSCLAEPVSHTRRPAMRIECLGNSYFAAQQFLNVDRGQPADCPVRAPVITASLLQTEKLSPRD
jgi:hypothetical protein